MSGTEQQMEIDLGDLPKVEAQNEEEPILEIIKEGEETQQVATAPAQKNESDPEEALKKLQKRLDDERKAREEAETLYRQAMEQARQAAIEAQDSRIHLVSGAMETLKRDEEILTAHLKQAMEIGDYDKAAEIQKNLATNSSKMLELERGYDELRRAAPPPPVQPQNVQRELTVDDIIQQVTPRSAEWLKKHREYLPDQRSLRIMGRAHEDAIDMGLIPESDQYFAFVENRMGINKAARSDYQEYDAMSDAAKPTKTRQSPPAAPVSRQPMDAPARPGVIRLTAEEVEAAKISGITPQEYYKLKMQDRNRN